MATLIELARQLANGKVSARALIEDALERACDPAGEGARIFIQVAAATARARADEIDRLRAAGHAPAAYAGIPVTIKDLFDVAGEVTLAGSRVLQGRPPAARDAVAVARLRSAGFVFIGRSNMTEFAYSGLGLNPHYGTPRNVFERRVGRIPGGSTSGGAVAVADGIAAASVGTDTGGSCRIPAAFNGIVGFKPTAERVSREGAIPLSQTLDSVGPLAHSVECCAIIDAVLRGVEPQPLIAPQPAAPRLLLPSTLVLDEMEQIVARTFELSLARLRAGGITVTERPVAALARIPSINATGGLAAAEAYAWHRALLSQRASEYDPRVATRILKGRDMSSADVERIRHERAKVIADVNDTMRDFDALLLPTVPIIAPPLSDFADDAHYARMNALVLRNPSLANFLDGCSISLPIHEPGTAPVGLMLIGRHGEDERLFQLAHSIERILGRSGHTLSAIA